MDFESSDSLGHAFVFPAHRHHTADSDSRITVIKFNFLDPRSVHFVKLQVHLNELEFLNIGCVQFIVVIATILSYCHSIFLI